jgi:hypothetical protein
MDFRTAIAIHSPPEMQQTVRSKVEQVIPEKKPE